MTREKESRDGNKTQYRLTQKAPLLSGSQSAMQGAASWPIVGAPVVADVQAPGFLPVTEEALSRIVERLVPSLNPHKIIVFGSYVYGAPTPDGSDVHVMLVLHRRSRQVIVANEQLDGPDVVGEFLRE